MRISAHNNCADLEGGASSLRSSQRGWLIAVCESEGVASMAAPSRNDEGRIAECKGQGVALRSALQPEKPRPYFLPYLQPYFLTKTTLVAAMIYIKVLLTLFITLFFLQKQP